MFFHITESHTNTNAHRIPKPITVNTVAVGAIDRSMGGKILGSAHAISPVIATINCDGYVEYTRLSMRHRTKSHKITHIPNTTSGNRVVISQLVNQLINSSTGSYIHTISKIYDPDIHGKIIALLHKTHHMKYHRSVAGKVNCKMLVISIQMVPHTTKYQRFFNDQYLKRNRSIEAIISHENKENISTGFVSKSLSSHDAQTMIAVSIHATSVTKKFH